MGSAWSRGGVLYGLSQNSCFEGGLKKWAYGTLGACHESFVHAPDSESMSQWCSFILIPFQITHTWHAGERMPVSVSNKRMKKSARQWRAFWLLPRHTNKNMHVCIFCMHTWTYKTYDMHTWAYMRVGVSYFEWLLFSMSFLSLYTVHISCNS
jgi:hypothetical protein